MFVVNQRGECAQVPALDGVDGVRLRPPEKRRGLQPKPHRVRPGPQVSPFAHAK